MTALLVKGHSATQENPTVLIRFVSVKITTVRHIILNRESLFSTFSQITSQKESYEDKLPQKIASATVLYVVLLITTA